MENFCLYLHLTKRILTLEIAFLITRLEKHLVISYDEKYGSPNREDIDQEIRDWKLRKLIS